MDAETLNAKHQDLKTEIQTLIVLNHLDGDKLKSLNTFRSQFEKFVSKKLNFKSDKTGKEFFQELKVAVDKAETELSSFLKAQGIIESFKKVGAKESELKGVLKVQERLAKVLAKRYNLEEQLNKSLEE